MEKIKITEFDWFTKDNELVIKDGIALRDIKAEEELISYGQVIAEGTMKHEPLNQNILTNSKKLGTPADFVYIQDIMSAVGGFLEEAYQEMDDRGAVCFRDINALCFKWMSTKDIEPRAILKLDKLSKEQLINLVKNQREKLIYYEQ